MSQPLIDLNLIRAFVAIYEAGTVSAAARQLNLTQPSVSHALARLRDLLRDPLFARVATRMQPTRTAEQLYSTFRRSLDDIMRAVAATREFDPATTTRRFHLALSDLGELYFVPLLMEEISRTAPLAALQIEQLDEQQIPDWLEIGKIDAAIGSLGPIPRMRRLALFKDTYVCLVNRKHPWIGEQITLEEYGDAKHAVVAPFSGHHLVEDMMAEMGLRRKVALRTPHFTPLRDVVACSDIVLTLPMRIAQLFAASGQMRVLSLPFHVPSFDVNLYWKEQVADAAPLQWFRETIHRALVGRWQQAASLRSR
jgi:DNA-binding transcriptional LysR family regulator